MTCGYNGKPWTYSYSPEDRFEFDVPLPEQYGSFPEELVNAAKKMGDLFHGERICVMYGGGMDSEAVLWGFEKAGIPHQVVCVADSGGGNARELADVATEVEVFSFNAREWLTSNECKKIAEEAQQSYCSMMFLVHTLLHHLRDRVVVLGVTEPEMEKRFQLGIVEHEWTYSWWKLFFNNGIRGAPLFYSSFPELYYSYVQGLATYGTKQTLYHVELGLRSRPKVKWERQMQFWRPRGFWLRTAFIPMADILVRANLGFV